MLTVSFSLETKGQTNTVQANKLSERDKENPKIKLSKVERDTIDVKRKHRKKRLKAMDTAIKESIRTSPKK